MRLGDAAELGLPVAVADDPVDVALARSSVSQRVAFDVLKLTMRGGAGRVVGVEDRLDRPFADVDAGDRGRDPLAGHVGDLLVHRAGPDRCRPCSAGSRRRATGGRCA